MPQIKKEVDADSLPPRKNISVDDIYDYYQHQLLPSILASLPILFERIKTDTCHNIRIVWSRIVRFLIPWSDESYSISALWNQTVLKGISLPISNTSPGALADIMLRNFDTNNDGHISKQEMRQMTELFIDKLPELKSNIMNNWSWWDAWPMMDWKILIFLWRAFGGFLIVLTIITIVPGRMHGYSGRFLRWPILALTYAMITVELYVYIVIRLFIACTEMLFGSKKHHLLRRKMTQAKSYNKWHQLASELDSSQGRDAWKNTTKDEMSFRYNWPFIKSLMSDMRTARKRNDSLMALAVLRQCTRKNVGGIMSDEMFSYTNTGEPKNIVKEFISEVEETLCWVTDQAKQISIQKDVSALDNGHIENSRKNIEYKKDLSSKMEQEKKKLLGSMLSWATLNFNNGQGNNTVHESNSVKSQISSSSLSSGNTNEGKKHEQLPSFHRENVIIFLKRARAAYGRSCICLSGGAMMGCYHFGVVKTLFEEDTLPRIMSGTSAGSCIAAMICTRSDDEIRRDLTPENMLTRMKVFETAWPKRLKNMYKTGYLFDSDEWHQKIKWFTCGDMTFEEAYQKTGRVLCITLSTTTKKSPPILINYVTAPNVVISSAVLASAAVPGLIKPVRLQVKGADGKVQHESKGELFTDGSIQQDIPITALSETFNCQFFLASQVNPHIAPFFYNSKGDVGRPSRWFRGYLKEDAWRGGFLLSAMELYLKNDMRAKFHFLNDIEVAVGFTSTLMTQQYYSGTTTILPPFRLADYFNLFSDATLKGMNQYFQGGSVSAYHHCEMIKLHHRISRVLGECLLKLEDQKRGRIKSDSEQEQNDEANKGFKAPVDVIVSKADDEIQTTSDESSTASGGEVYSLGVLGQ